MVKWNLNMRRVADLSARESSLGRFSISSPCLKAVTDMASPEPEPPYYILVSHSPLDSQNTSSTLSHPVVQYHYADDSPLALLPHTPDEHVLVLDYTDLTSSGVDSASVPTVKSISRNLAVTGVKVSEAPGAATAHEELQINRNDKMYIVETCTTTEDRCAACDPRPARS